MLEKKPQCSWISGAQKYLENTKKICLNWRQQCGISRIFCREEGICCTDAVCLDLQWKMSGHGQCGIVILPALPFSLSFCWERAIKPKARWIGAYKQYASSFPSTTKLCSGFIFHASLPPPRYYRSLFNSVLGWPEPHLLCNIRTFTCFSSSQDTGFFRDILSISTICFVTRNTSSLPSDMYSISV